MAHSVRLSRRARVSIPALLVLSLAAGCADLTTPWTAPEVALLGAQPKLLGLDRQSFLVNLGVTNPNDRALPIKGLSYRVQVEGQDLAEGTSELARLIPAGGTERVDVEVNSNLLGLMPSLPGLLLTKNKLAWTVSGIAYLDVGGVRLPVPYRHSGTIAPAALISDLICRTSSPRGPARLRHLAPRHPLARVAGGDIARSLAGSGTAARDRPRRTRLRGRAEGPDPAACTVDNTAGAGCLLRSAQPAVVRVPSARACDGGPIRHGHQPLGRAPDPSPELRAVASDLGRTDGHRGRRRR